MAIAVVGAGSWGTALAQVLATNNNDVVIWARKEEVASSINENHINPRYLSNSILSSHISATSCLEECIKDAQAIVVVTPSRLMREMATLFKPIVSETTPIILCSKGVEQGTSLLPIEVFDEIIGNKNRLAVLSGPNHAEEVILGQPSGAVIASSLDRTAVFFRDLFASTFFRCYTSSDYYGVELCAAYKNVIAIAVGISYGLGYGDNTASLLITRGMAEMGRLVNACGGDPMTVMGLAGAGDMIATCTSEHSRNRSFGKLLAEGGKLSEYEEKTHMVVEGALACQTICPLAEKYNVEIPIANVVRDIVWNDVSISDILASLFGRPLNVEFWGF